MTTPDPASTTRDRLASLDLLRFGAAAAVVLYHYAYRYVADDPAPLSVVEAVARHGYLGVELFFLISGFVVLWSARGRTAARFVRARVLRLYPEFWIAVLVSAAVFRTVPGGFGDALTPRDIVLNLSMIPQYLAAPYVDGVYWTLGAEIKFYALLWLVIVLRQLPRIEGILVGWVALALLATVVDLGGGARSVLIHPYGSLFASGGLFFLVFESGWTPLRAVALLLGLCGSTLHGLENMSGFIDAPHVTEAARWVTVLLIAAFYAVFAVVTRYRWSPRTPATVALLGSLTYPLYLLHNTGKELFLLPGAPLPRWLGIPAATIFSLAVSWSVLRLATRYVQPVLRRAVDGVYRPVGW